MNKRKVAEELIKLAKELMGGKTKTAYFSKRFKALQYWDSKNTTRTVRSTTIKKAREIIEASGVEQILVESDD